MALTDRQERFAVAVAMDGMTYADAYRQNYKTDGWSNQAIAATAHKLSVSPDIAMRITKLQNEQRSKAIEHLSMDVIGLLRIYIAIAMVDPNELISVKVGCCRFCHGDGHAYQWKEREFVQECDAAADRKDGKLPDIAGGFGFDHTVPPHPDCPECRGEGVHRLVPKDTTKLSPGALHLYRGAQQTKEGIKRSEE